MTRNNEEVYEGLKHYFIIRFPRHAGALGVFVNQILGLGDDITLLVSLVVKPMVLSVHSGLVEYSKKHNREKEPALIGIELQNKENFAGLIQRLKDKGFDYEYINDKPNLFQYLV
ncbi:MAG: hypothetical protein PF517_16510 [Salinivirgaceae bacterium]|jgi:threonine dehydratase|nr:hypothetical protein [Salinivirgaceae bacterium]